MAIDRQHSPLHPLPLPEARLGIDSEEVPSPLARWYLEHRLEEAGLSLPEQELSAILKSLESEPTVRFTDLEEAIESILSHVPHATPQLMPSEDDQEFTPSTPHDPSTIPLPADDPSRNLIQFYLQEAGKHPTLTPEEELVLARRIKNPQTPRRAKDISRAEFLVRNLRLVVSIAARYAKQSNKPLLELIQEGNEGLIRGLERFDPEKGYKFSTYATWWIRQSITRYIMENSGPIRWPIYLVEIQGKVKRYVKEFTLTHGRGPGNSEIATGLNLPLYTVQYIKNLRQPVSLDKPMDQSDPAETLADVVHHPLPIDYTLQDHAVQQILKKELCFKERMVICLRYALFDYITPDDLTQFCGPYVTFETLQQYERCAVTGGLTLQQIGKICQWSGSKGRTRERIRQLEARALNRLRHPSRSQHLIDYYTDNI